MGLGKWHEVADKTKDGEKKKERGDIFVDSDRGAIDEVDQRRD